MNRPLGLHIGHHFFGSGNIGDDLMLGGFLEGITPGVRMTCASQTAATQRVRFPQVQWLPYDPASRAAAIEACDAWVGVGDTPFQVVVGTWFLDHLAEELATCRRYGKPMFFIGVGVNEAEALDHPHAREVLAYASHVWARDAQSADWIARVCGAAKVTASADLAHAWLRGRPVAPVERGVTGYVLNFEDQRQFDPRALCELAASTDGEQRWLVQEGRELPGSERALLGALTEECRRRLSVRVPDYDAPSVSALVDAWGAPERLLTSRYHAAVVGAWAGARVLSVRRSDKVAALAAQMGLASVPSVTDAPAVRVAWEAARVLPRETLNALAERALSACRELLDLQNLSSGATGGLPARASPQEQHGSRRAGASGTPSGSATASKQDSPAGVAAFASVDEMNSPPFRAFMEGMNAFAAAHGLRQFTNWTKIWEYPWLWQQCLSRVPWRGARVRVRVRVVDLGSEISPMPWYLATLGATVRLIEVSPEWVPVWTALREKLAVDVDWHIVASEQIPLPDGWADGVTSFSVIEHQPDKRKAVAEVARVLRPGGWFAVSFDVCEPAMGMTFPEWNGRALTVREFEDELWRHPAFANSDRPAWNWDAVRPFLEWHRTTAPHHNYVAAAAVLRRRRGTF